MPRPEIDVLAYSGRDRELKAIECKSFLDSRGVIAADLRGVTSSTRYKLFKNEPLRIAVFKTLVAQLVERRACPEDVKITLCLACGKIASDEDRKQLKSLFSEKGWTLFDDQWISGKVRAMADVGYENQTSTVVTKLLKNHFRIVDVDR
jgi:hypothetical protein